MVNFQTLLPVIAVFGFSWSSVCAFAPTSRLAKAAFVTSNSRLSAVSSKYEFALLFDCDGVILETEELHRLAYNKAFREFDLTIDGKPVVWEVSRLTPR
jgi:hypothetical protein